MLYTNKMILLPTGTMAALLQEIVAIYPAINPPTLTVSIPIHVFVK